MIQHNLLAFIAHFGYIGIFGALVLGIIGVPVPDEILLTFAGYLISQGKFHYIPTIMVSVIGSITGMSISYFMGQKFGYPLLEKYGRKIHISKEKLYRIGRRSVLISGFFIFAAVYFGFGMVKSVVWIWVLFVLYSLLSGVCSCAPIIR
ncbi:hypothetical protein PaeBR_14800 [Paenibacillus sp. BR2-3]|uniref:DedA family protein n=1 Tax=Paenibacillus sp. BR2-3 TaxID=3048494 RepID=UPI00397792AD